MSRYGRGVPALVALVLGSAVSASLGAPATTIAAASQRSQVVSQAPQVQPHALSNNVPYRFYNWRSGYCLDVPGFSYQHKDDPAFVYDCNPSKSSDNQLWYLQPTRVVDGAQLYLIRNFKGGWCLELPDYGAKADGTRVQVNPCSAVVYNDNQEWSLAGDPVNDHYYLVNYQSSTSDWTLRCLDVWGVNTARPNTQVGLYHCRMNDDHMWAVIP